MPKKISLRQFLMKTGKFEKVFDCVSAIKKGKISVGGHTITNPSYFFNPKKSLVKLGGEKIKPVRKLYCLLNKPAGYLCQKSSSEKSIYDLLEKLDIPKESKNSLFAVGRLDKETEGLIVITNDGKLSSLLMKPEGGIIKKYYAVLEKPIDANKIKTLEQGTIINIDNEKYKTKPGKISISGKKEVYISISEGKKRQIRKMFETIGNKVIHLKRVSIGGLPLGNLGIGEIKQISKEELIKKIIQ